MLMQCVHHFLPFIQSTESAKTVFVSGICFQSFIAAPFAFLTPDDFIFAKRVFSTINKMINIGNTHVTLSVFQQSNVV